jgi:hypothetical protein
MPDDESYNQTIMVSVWPTDAPMLENYDSVDLNALPTDFSIDLTVNSELIVVESEIDTFENGGFVYKIPADSDCVDIVNFNDFIYTTGYRIYKVIAKSEACEESLAIEVAGWVTDRQDLIVPVNVTAVECYDGCPRD